ncbi:MAG TPA: AI-2E family transporter [Anaerolineae bacterium]|nr:AI-2E family transporter [Anaerolineae bacterium]
MTFFSSARFKRMLLWTVMSLLVIGMLWAARAVLAPFILGLVLAYLLLPLVHWLERHLPSRLRAWGVARPLSIILTYLLFVVIVAGFIAFVVPVMGRQVGTFVERIPVFSDRLQRLVADGLGWYEANIPDEWQQGIEANLQDIAQEVFIRIRDGLGAMLRTVFSSLNFFVGLVIIPFWLFYILQDESRVQKGLMEALHPELRPDFQSLGTLVDGVLSAYVRGQLLLCLFVGVLATIALLIIGVPFAPVLGLIAGVFEVLPNIGPYLGAIPAILIALATDPISAIWVALAFFAIQMVENLILVPRISGKSVKLHPALVMMVLVVGGSLAGLWGMLIAVPVTAVIRDVFLYLYLRLLDEPLSPAEAMARIRSEEKVQLEA